MITASEIQRKINERKQLISDKRSIETSFRSGGGIDVSIDDNQFVVAGEFKGLLGRFLLDFFDKQIGELEADMLKLGIDLTN